MNLSNHRKAIVIGLLFNLMAVLGCSSSKEKRNAVFPFAQSSSSAEKPVLDAAQTADVELAMARSAEHQGQDASAMRIYRQLLEANPKHPEATHRIAILYDRQGDFEKSAEWFQRALERKPGDPELLCDIGYSHYSQGRLDTAEAHLRRAIELSPGHHRAHNHLGMVLAQAGNLEAAFNAFCAANSTPAQAYTNLALSLALNGNLEEARRHLAFARDASPNKVDLQERWTNLESLIASRAAPTGEIQLTNGTAPSGQYIR